MITSLFSSVLSLSLKASFVIALVLLARWVLRRASRRYSYLLWVVVLFRLLLPGAIELPIAQETPAPILNQMDQVVRFPEKLVTQQIDSSVMAGEVKVASSLQFIDVVAYIWFIGIVVMAVIAIRSLVTLRKRISTAKPQTNQVFLVKGITSAFTLGRNIYLPEGMNQSERELVLAHEQYHVKRLDSWWKSVACFALMIHWFNPLVWLAFIKATQDMEESCDEAVLSGLTASQRVNYAQVLLDQSINQASLGIPLAFGDGNPKTRVRHVLNWHEGSRGWLIVAIVLAITILGFAVFRLTSLGKANFDLSEIKHNEPYVTNQTVYQNPLDSYIGFDGDSGKEYLFEEDRVVIKDLFSRESEQIDTVSWDWQAFPYDKSEWKNEFSFGITPTLEFNSKTTRYQKLSDKFSLLQTEDALYIMENRTLNQMGDSIWSIYRLIPKSELGESRWRAIDDLVMSSRIASFEFQLDLDYDEVQVVADQGSLLVDNVTYGEKNELRYAKGKPIYWSPIGKEGLLEGSKLYLGIYKGDEQIHTGVITIEPIKQDGNIVEYTAFLRSETLKLDQAGVKDPSIIRLK